MSDVSYDRSQYLKNKIYLKMRQRDLREKQKTTTKWSDLHEKVFKIQKANLKRADLKTVIHKKYTTSIKWVGPPNLFHKNLHKSEKIKIELKIVCDEITKNLKLIRSLSETVNEMIVLNEKLGNYICGSVEFKFEQLRGRIINLVRN